MLDSIVAQTNLPNLHPALVHFPIVILLLASLVDIASLIFPKRAWLRKSSLLLWVLGAMAVGVTFWSGRQAAETVQIVAQAEVPLTHHENSALKTLWFFGIYSGIRILFQFLAYRRWIHLLIILLALPGQALLFQTADLGGGLVYKYGVGVHKAEEKLAKPAPETAEGGKPVIEGNRISWVFTPGSEKHLSSFLKLQSGNISGVQASTEQRDSKTFLVLTTSVSKPFVFVFEPVLHDTQIEAEVDLSGFAGKFGLIHHFKQQGYDSFLIDKQTAVLGRKTTEGEKKFSQKKMPSISSPLVLKAVGAGTHFRGYVNGKLLVHGHGEAAAPGKTGIILEGTGKVAIASLTVTPISEHEH